MDVRFLLLIVDYETEVVETREACGQTVGSSSNCCTVLPVARISC